MKTSQLPIAPKGYKPSQIFKNSLLPIIVIGLVVLADIYWIDWTSITPLGCTIVLTILALYMRPLTFSFWAVICSVVSYVMLRYGYNLDTATISRTSFFWMIGVQTAGNIFVNFVLLLLCIHRQKLNEQHDEMLGVLVKLPMPVIVSDAAGALVFLNDRASKMLEIAPEEGVGLSYFALLLHQTGKGENIKKYVELIDSAHSEISEISIRTRNRPTKLLKGMLVAIDSKQGRQLITVITENYATSAVLYAMAARLAAKRPPVRPASSTDPVAELKS